MVEGGFVGRKMNWATRVARAQGDVALDTIRERWSGGFGTRRCGTATAQGSPQRDWAAWPLGAGL